MNWHTGEHANTWIQTLWCGLDVEKHDKIQPAESSSLPEHISRCKITFNPIILLMKQELDTHTQSAAAFFLLNCFLASDIRPESSEPSSLIFFSFSYLILIPMCLCNI